MSNAELGEIEKFLKDLTDPEGFGFSVTSEVRRRALELQAMLTRQPTPDIIDDE